MGDINSEELETHVSDTLKRAGKTNCEKLIELSDHELLSLGNISLKDVQSIRNTVAESIIKKKIIRVSSMIDNPTKQWDKLSTGCVNIDKLLRGGIPRRGVTELSGESGLGKTQLCLQLAIMVQLSSTCGGFNAGAVYICTEDKFPSPRLHQLFNMFPLSKHEDLKRLGDNVFIDHIADVDGLKQCVLTQLPLLLRQHSIGLIVIDSITAVFRVDYDKQDLFTRAKDLRTIGLQLHLLAKQYNVSILCVNQVSSVIKDSSGCQSTPIPALGIAWSNLIRTRLQMIRTEGEEKQLCVIFAPDLPKASCFYNISACGISGSELIY